MKNYVLIRKFGGFYNVFDDDAIIMNYLCDYKISNGKSGFPLNSLDKVMNILTDNKVNFIIRENMEDKEKKNFKKNNKYHIILEKGKKKINIHYRINIIMDKINELSYEKLSILLDTIEDFINEC